MPRNKALLEKYNNNDYNLVSIDEIKKYIETKISIHRWVNAKDYINNIDILCSTLYYLRDVLDQIDIKDWSQKFYLIYHDLVGKYPKAIDDPSRLPDYRDFGGGYNNKTTEFLKNKKGNFRKLIEKTIKKAGFKIIKSYDLNDRYKHAVLKCETCGKEFSSALCNGHYKEIICPVCSGKTSRAEIELLEYVNSITNTQICEHDRSAIKPQELDIYLPEFKIALEYNGMYWHSEEKGKGQYYHIDKTNKCKEVGIDLIHIFEKEWNENKEKIKNKLFQLFSTNFSETLVGIVCKKLQKNNNNLLYFLEKNNEIIAEIELQDSTIINIDCSNKIKDYDAYSLIISNILSEQKNMQLSINIDNCWITDINLFEKLGFKKMSDNGPTTIIKKVWNCGTTLMVL